MAVRFVTHTAASAVGGSITFDRAVWPVMVQRARVASVAVVAFFTHTIAIGGARTMPAAAQACGTVHCALPPVRVGAVPSVTRTLAPCRARAVAVAGLLVEAGHAASMSKETRLASAAVVAAEVAQAVATPGAIAEAAPAAARARAGLVGQPASDHHHHHDDQRHHHCRGWRQAFLLRVAGGSATAACRQRLVRRSAREAHTARAGS